MMGRPNIKDIMLALGRAERWEREGDLRAALNEVQDVITVLKDEENRIVQKRRVPEHMRQTWNGEKFKEL